VPEALEGPIGAEAVTKARVTLVMGLKSHASVRSTKRGGTAMGLKPAPSK